MAMEKFHLVCFVGIIVGCVCANIDLDLWNSAKTGDEEGIERALSSGGNPNWGNPARGRLTALHAAAYSNYPAIVQSLLNNAADIEARTDRGITPLYDASRQGSNEAVSVLIAAGANIDAQTDKGTTALMAAVADYGHLSTVKVLIKAQANVHLTRQDGWSALHFAAYHNRQDIAVLLLRQGANNKQRPYPSRSGQGRRI